MFSNELAKLCCVTKGPNHGASPIPEEGQWIQVKEIKDISGFTHGCGTCAPQMGTSKLTLNVKEGIIQEVLIENIGCSGMTQSAAIAAEILPGKTILEALNTDLVCDAINNAMKQIFLQLVYGRTQSCYSDGGLPIGAAWEDLGAEVCSQVGTSYSSLLKGPRYLEITGGYVTRMALDHKQEIIGYEYVQIGKMMELIAQGIGAEEALNKTKKTFGRFSEAVKYIDPRRD